MMNKRIFLLSFVFTLFVMILTGCHGSHGLEAFEIPENFDESKQYEITFWAKNDTNVTQTQIYRKAIDSFQKLYPNIKVNIRLYTDYGKIYNDVITNIATNTTPNVCITYPDHIATYLSGINICVPLDELMDNKEYGLNGSKLKFDSPKREEIIGKFLDDCKIHGEYYAIPFMRSTEACYVNKTFVEALGYTLPEKLTWDFIWEVSDAALEKNDDGTYKINGQNVLIPCIYKSTDNMMIQMLKQKDEKYSTEDGEVFLFNDTTKDFLKEISGHFLSGAFSTFKISSYPANFLNAGQCIFAIDSTAGSTWMGSKAPLSDISEDSIVDFETEVMVIPQYNPETPYMISQGPSVCIFNKSDAGEVMASWLFAQYLLTNEVQIAYAQTEGYVPVTLKAQNDPSYVDYLSRGGEDNSLYYDVKLKASKLLIDNMQNTFVTPVFNGSASLRDAAGQMIEDTGKAVRRNQIKSEEYYDDLFKSVTALYRLDSKSNQGLKKKELGDMPGEAVALIAILITVWVLLITYAITSRVKNKKH
ncbi:MAG: extracellular solute-binding protein [Lachnospiraceae bacterium]|nr:extracellular solute-binding protein [Lachnospiraceae bacterium]